jgi:hypothetical protein
MDSYLHNTLFLHNDYKPYGSAPDDHVMLQQQDKRFHKVHGYSADTSLAGKLPVDYLQGSPFR